MDTNKLHTFNPVDDFTTLESVTISKNSRGYTYSFKLVAKEIDEPQSLKRLKDLKEKLDMICTIQKVKDKVETITNEELEE